MRIAVLLSASLHPVSRRPALASAEAQAVALALSLGGETVAFHAGATIDAARQALGHGLGRLVHLQIPAGDDPVPSLTGALVGFAPDLVLAGPRSVGGDETGMVPYRVARALGFAILADAASISVEANGFTVEQALPKGLRRRLRERGSLVVTVSPAAIAPRPYAFAAERRGIVERGAGIAAPSIAEEQLSERPGRQRAKLLPAPNAGGSAAERLRAATQVAKAPGGEVMISPDPDVAARAILDHLRAIGVLAPRAGPGVP